MAVSRKSIVLSLTGLGFINLIASLDATALSVCLPAIAQSFGATSTQAYWAGTSFVLSSAAFQPIFASFSNAFGRKPMILLALVLFMVGTVVCATATNIVALLAGRTTQGAGGGALLSMTYVVLADLLSLRNRAKGMAVISLVWLLGTVCGPVTGGGFTTNVSWRWVFWLCVPFVSISMLLITLFLHTAHQSLRTAQALKEVDYLGAGLLIVSLTGFLAALSWGGSLYPWSSWRTILPLVLGGLGLMAWVVYEAFVPSLPIFPLVVLNNRTTCSAFFGTLILGVVQFGLLYYLPLYYQISKGYSPLISGIALWPQCLLSGPTTTLSGWLISKTGHYQLFIWSGWWHLTLGCGLLVFLDSQTTVPQWIFMNAVSGVGLGLLFTSQSVATQAATPDQHKAIVSSLTPFFRTLGQALGIVIGDAIFQNAFQANLIEVTSEELRNRAGEIASDTALLTSVLEGLAVGSRERAELMQAFHDSLCAVWWTLFSLAAFAGLVSLLTQQLDLDRGSESGRNVNRDDIEKAPSTEPIFRSYISDLRPISSQSRLPPGVGMQDEGAKMKNMTSFSTLGSRQHEDMMEEARREFAHRHLGFEDDLVM